MPSLIKDKEITIHLYIRSPALRKVTDLLRVEAPDECSLQGASFNLQCTGEELTNCALTLSLLEFQRLL